jgi:subtilisin family serine protease
MKFILCLLAVLCVYGYVDVTNKEYPHIFGEYIITYHLNTTEEEAFGHWDLMATAGIEFIHRYNTGFHKGFAAKITDDEVIAQLQNNPLVMAIEVNGIVNSWQLPVCAGFTDAAQSWGLSRVCHSGDISNGLVEHFWYDQADFDGRGTEIYVIDTGILTTHVDFGGRARWGIAIAPGGPVDGNGHGTHCAGTAAGTLHGIAKNANIVAVKVLGAGGSGTWADVAAGVNFVTDNGTPFKSVASMSLGGPGAQQALTTAINNCVASGIPVVVAAGNSNANACNYSPSGIPSVISVGSSEIAGFAPNEFDSRSSFSNFGTCVHLFAPGRDITSAWIGSNTATRLLSGTSMACPHVAGVVATLLSANNNLSPQAVKDLLQSTWQQEDLISNVGAGSPNFLLYNNCD